MYELNKQKSFEGTKLYINFFISTYFSGALTDTWIGYLC